MKATTRKQREPEWTYAPLGSVSTGTLRTEDLIDSISFAIVNRFPDTAVAREADALASSCPQDAETLEALYDLAQGVAAPYCRFGSTEGDGADIGWWIDDYALNDDVRNGSLLAVSDTSELPESPECHDADFCLHINDHGNMTLYQWSYTLRAWIEVWSIV